MQTLCIHSTQTPFRNQILCTVYWLLAIGKIQNFQVCSTISNNGQKRSKSNQCVAIWERYRTFQFAVQLSNSFAAGKFNYSSLFLIQPLFKGPIISGENFCVFNSSKKRTKNFCPSRLGAYCSYAYTLTTRVLDNMPTWHIVLDTTTTMIVSLVDCFFQRIRIISRIRFLDFT